MRKPGFKKINSLKWYILAFTLAFLVQIHGSSAFVDFDSALIDAYSLNNGTSNHVSCTNNYWLINGSDDPANIPGVFGNGKFFNGTTQYLYSDNISSQNYTHKTFNFWIKRGNDSGTQTYFNYYVNNNYFMRAYSSADNLRLQYAVNGANKESTAHSLTSYFDNTTWHMITITHNPIVYGVNYNFSLYVDSVLVYDEDLVVNHDYSTKRNFKLRLGTYDGTTQLLNGSLDEFSSFNQVLNQSEINFLYNSGNGYSVCNRLNLTFKDISGNTLSSDTVKINYINQSGDNVTDTITDGTTFVNVPYGYNNLSAIVSTDDSFVTSYYTFVNVSDQVQLDYVLVNKFLINVSFQDSVTGDSILDNITLDIIGNSSYTNFSDNGSIFTMVNYGVYDLIGEDINGTYYDKSYYYDKSFVGVSSLNGSIIGEDFIMYFNNLTGEGSNNISVYVYDQSLRRLEGAIIHLQRFNIDTNDFITVQIGETNFDGQVVLSANLNNDIYKFVVYYEDVIVKSTNPSIIYSNLVNLFVDTSSSALGDQIQSINGVKFACPQQQCIQFNNDTNTLSMTWYSLPDNVQRLCLNVTRINALEDPLMVNTTCTTSQSGTINTVVVMSNDYVYEANAYLEITSSPQESYLLSSLTLDFFKDALNNNIGLFLTIIIVLVSSGIAMFNPTTIFITVPLGLIMSTVLKLNNIGYQYTVPILAVGIILTILFKKNG